MKQPFGRALQRAWIDLRDPQAVWQIAILPPCFVLAEAALLRAA